MNTRTKILLIAVAVIGLVIVIDTTDQPVSTTQQVQKEIPVVTASTDSELKEYGNKVSRVISWMELANRSYTKAGVTGSQLNFTEAIDHALDAQRRYIQAKELLGKITPPQKASIGHNLLTQALDKTILATSILIEGIQTLDADTIGESSRIYSEGIGFLNEASVEFTTLILEF